ncbi:hypothetical protein PTSG_06248 [Salpingoeca rosetta]|uniref:Calponin-homology (CH) domain-containing protein n=1 Tax=Salpingoeca rosetta (strain ATCC 50818 / BSB-021) TaxID=946362 RepID=F2UCD1_SALR5|nr:uncharacterized protein PTSG_06248 [Salpingoeca rosetta]EGD74238.1 hypothetical protein PTSG_06248 [Salpingoeca rosetta]|eukprot:XP_004993138.1 hypothetical protein PTSG_06248 [Salpingoeca rosetta]
MSHHGRASATFSVTSSTVGLRSMHAGLNMDDVPSRSGSKFNNSYLDASWRSRPDSSYLHGGTSQHQELTLRRKRRQWVEQRLFAYREDLADWFSLLFAKNITEASFISDIEDGILLCRLATMIDARYAESDKTRGYAVGHTQHRGSIAHTKLRYNSRAAKGTFFARDNVSTFISWARNLGIDETVLFETGDLVERKNEKHVLYCLMEIARVQDVLEPPSLIKLERSIDRNGFIAVDTDALEAAITDLCHRLNTPRSRIERLSPGFYTVDGREFYLALIRDRVLVRNGKHWDPLEHILSQAPENGASRPATAGDGSGTTKPRRPSATAAAPQPSGRSPSSTQLGAASGDAQPAATSPRSAAFASAPRSPLDRSTSNLDGDAVSSRGPGSGGRGPSSAPLSASGLTLPVPRGRSGRNTSTSSGGVGGGGAGGGVDDSRSSSQNTSRRRSNAGESVRPAILQDSLHGPAIPTHDNQALLDEIEELQRRVAELEGDLTEAEAACDDERCAHDDTRAQLADLKDRLAAQPSSDDFAELEAQNSEAAQRLKDCIDDMERMRDDYDAALERKDQELAGRDSTINLLQEQLDAAAAPANVIEPEHVEKLNAQLADAHAAVEDEKQKSAALQEKADALGELHRVHENTRAELEDALDRICHLEKLLADEESSSAAAVAALEDELKSAAGEKDSAAAENAQLKADNDSAQDTIKDLNNTIDAQTKELDRLREELENAGGDAARAALAQGELGEKADMLAAELAKERAAAEAAQEEKEALKKEVDDKANALAAAEAERDAALKQAEDDKAAADAEADALNDEIADLKSKLADASKALEDKDGLQSVLQDRDAELALLREQLDNKTKESEDLQGKLDELQKRADELAGKLAAAEKEAADLQSNADAMARENEKASGDAERALAECSEARSDLEARLGAAESSLADRDDELAKLRVELDEAKDALATAQGEAADLKQELEDKSTDIEALNDTKRALEGQVEELRPELAATKEDRDAKQEQLNSANDRIAEIEALLANKEADADTSAAESGALQEQLQQLQIQYNLLQEGMIKAERKCEEEKKHLRDDRDRAIDDVVLLEDLNGRLLADIQALEERCSSLMLRLQQHEENLQDLQGLAQESQDAVLTLRRQKEEAEEEAAASRADRDTAQAELDAIAERERQEREAEEEEERRKREEEEEAARLQAEKERQEAEEHERAMKILEQNKELQKLHQNLGPAREDVADWINELLGTNIQPAALFHELQSGTVLCQLANVIDEHEEETRLGEESEGTGKGTGTRKPKSTATSSSASPGAASKKPSSSAAKSRGLRTPRTGAAAKSPRVKRKASNHPSVLTRASCPSAYEPIRRKRRRIPRYAYKPPEGQSVLGNYIKTRNIPYCPFEPKAKPGTTKARDNVNNFIRWARELGITDPDVFRADDLLHLKDPRRVLWGLFDVARRTRAIRVPRVVWLERLRYMQPTKAVKGDALDAAVRSVVNESINQPRLRVTRIAEGKYTFGEEMTKPLLMRITQKNVLVRVGGGWQSLRKYLETHFPTDPRVKAEKQRLEPIWDKNREAPKKYDSADGHKMNFQTTRNDMLFHE